MLDGTANVITGGPNSKEQLFAYDAYGSLIPGPALVTITDDAVTTLLYSGDQTDASTGLQYLRARYYDSVSGTFNRLDPFFGNLFDPLSLHKYLYVHGDPVNGIDPSGELLLGILVGAGIGALLGGVLSKAFGGSFWEGAGYGALGGTVGVLTFPLFAGIVGTSTLTGYLIATGGSGFFAGASVGGAHSYFQGNDTTDIIFDALESGVLGAAIGIGFGYLFAPAAIPRGGVVRNANFAQSSINKAGTFSKEGVEIYTQLAGRTINTVDDLAQAIRDGVVRVRDIPVDYVVKDGVKLILNTRTSTALERANIPQSRWYGSNKTGLEAYPGVKFDTLAAEQLRRNNLPPTGTSNAPQ